MKLEHASEVSPESINQDEILFVSDIESFTLKTKNYLLERISKRKLKVVVLIGDILSGFSISNRFYKIFNMYHEVFEMFYNTKKIMKKYRIKKIDQDEVARTYVGYEISEKLSKDYSKEIKYFKSFVKECYKKSIPVVLFSGNHDSLFSHTNLIINKEFIPILDEIASVKGLIIPANFEPLKLKKNLYLMGIHLDEEVSQNPEFPEIKNILEKLNENIERPEQIIFVSHIPGIKKFSRLGSKDISNLKKRFKFKYHYHGHCKDFHGEYVEEGVPTKSVHINID